MLTHVCKRPLNSSLRASLSTSAVAAAHRQHAGGAVRADRLVLRGNSPAWNIQPAVHAATQVHLGSMLARPAKLQRLTVLLSLVS